MILYSGKCCIYSHTCRLVMHEKGAQFKNQFIDGDGEYEALAKVNPYAETPTVVDRDYPLYDTCIINEFLDERLPHPPLMPNEPVRRAQARIMVHRIQRDWMARIRGKNGEDRRPSSNNRKRIHQELRSVSHHFENNLFALGEEFSLVDCYFAPLLWRMNWLKIDISKDCVAMADYGQRLFLRPAFIASLTSAEKELQ